MRSRKIRAKYYKQRTYWEQRIRGRREVKNNPVSIEMGDGQLDSDFSLPVVVLQNGAEIPVGAASAHLCFLVHASRAGSLGCYTISFVPAVWKQGLMIGFFNPQYPKHDAPQRTMTLWSNKHTVCRKFISCKTTSFNTHSHVGCSFHDWLRSTASCPCPAPPQ